MKLIDYSVKDRIGFITLNRPEKRNALSFELVEELKATFAHAEGDESVKVIVLKANLNFCVSKFCFRRSIHKIAHRSQPTSTRQRMTLNLRNYNFIKCVYLIKQFF